MKRDVVEVALRVASEYYEKHNAALTLRGLFYILANAMGLVPLTKSGYKRLSEALAKARYSGEFPWYLIKDTTRKVFHVENWTSYPDRSLSAEELLKKLEEYIDTYTSVTVNPWEDQSYRVIIVVEKDALVDVVMSFVREVFQHGVYQVRAIRGYDSATDIHELAETIKYLSENQTPVILQLGDYDPSGEDIVRDFRERLKMLSRREDIIFEKIAVTLDQIIELDLPCKPETMEEIEKLKRDPRYKKYVEKIQALAERDVRVKKLIEKYGTSEIRVELDALVALKPNEFKQILKKTIEKYFDYEIYEKVTKQREEELRKQAEKMREESLRNLEKLKGVLK